MTRLALLLALAASPTLAQDRPAPAVEHEFTDADEVLGATENPMVERLHARRRSARGTLVRPRTTFLPELYGSVENL